VTLYDVNTLLYAYKQIIVSMRQLHTKWYAKFLVYVFSLCFWYLRFPS